MTRRMKHGQIFRAMCMPVARLQCQQEKEEMMERKNLSRGWREIASEVGGRDSRERIRARFGLSGLGLASYWCRIDMCSSQNTHAISNLGLSDSLIGCPI
jgi:hypothetical protein